MGVIRRVAGWEGDLRGRGRAGRQVRGGRDQEAISYGRNFLVPAQSGAAGEELLTVRRPPPRGPAALLSHCCS